MYIYRFSACCLLWLLLSTSTMLANCYQEIEQKVDDNGYAWNCAPRYRGFIGESLLIGTSDINETRWNIYTSHGCQITPYAYIGLGLEVNHWPNWAEYNIAEALFSAEQRWVSVPIFAHFRTEIHRLYNKRASPFLDFKIGCSFGDIEGFYFAPSIGFHVYFGKSKTGLSASVGYDLQRADVVYEGGYIGAIVKESLGGVSFSVAFDF